MPLQRAWTNEGSEHLPAAMSNPPLMKFRLRVPYGGRGLNTPATWLLFDELHYREVCVGVRRVLEGDVSRATEVEGDDDDLDGTEGRSAIHVQLSLGQVDYTRCLPR